LPFATRRFQRRVNSFLKRFRILYFAHQPYAGHVAAQTLAAQLGRPVFEKFFSFAIVRNPWDRQVSFYTYMLKETRHRLHQVVKQLGSFEAYIQWMCANPMRSQRDFIFAENGEQLVDFVARYERLDEDFTAICARIGISASLPKMNVSKVRPYQEYYSEKTRDLVQQAFAADAQLFHYNY